MQSQCDNSYGILQYSASNLLNPSSESFLSVPQGQTAQQINLANLLNQRNQFDSNNSSSVKNTISLNPNDSLTAAAAFASQSMAAQQNLLNPDLSELQQFLRNSPQSQAALQQQQILSQQFHSIKNILPQDQIKILQSQLLQQDQQNQSNQNTISLPNFNDVSNLYNNNPNKILQPANQVPFGQIQDLQNINSKLINLNLSNNNGSLNSNFNSLNLLQPTNLLQQLQLQQQQQQQQQQKLASLQNIPSQLQSTQHLLNNYSQIGSQPSIDSLNDISKPKDIYTQYTTQLGNFGSNSIFPSQLQLQQSQSSTNLSCPTNHAIHLNQLSRTQLKTTSPFEISSPQLFYYINQNQQQSLQKLSAQQPIFLPSQSMDANQQFFSASLNDLSDKVQNVDEQNAGRIVAIDSLSNNNKFSISASPQQYNNLQLLKANKLEEQFGFNPCLFQKPDEAQSLSSDRTIPAFSSQHSTSNIPQNYQNKQFFPPQYQPHSSLQQIDENLMQNQINLKMSNTALSLNDLENRQLFFQQQQQLFQSSIDEIQQQKLLLIQNNSTQSQSSKTFLHETKLQNDQEQINKIIPITKTSLDNNMTLKISNQKSQPFNEEISKQQKQDNSSVVSSKKLINHNHLLKATKFNSSKDIDKSLPNDQSSQKSHSLTSDSHSKNIVSGSISSAQQQISKKKRSKIEEKEQNKLQKNGIINVENSENQNLNQNEEDNDEQDQSKNNNCNGAKRNNEDPYQNYHYLSQIKNQLRKQVLKCFFKNVQSYLEKYESEIARQFPQLEKNPIQSLCKYWSQFDNPTQRENLKNDEYKALCEKLGINSNIKPLGQKGLKEVFCQENDFSEGLKFLYTKFNDDSTTYSNRQKKEKMKEYYIETSQKILEDIQNPNNLQDELHQSLMD